MQKMNNKDTKFLMDGVATLLAGVASLPDIPEVIANKLIECGTNLYAEMKTLEFADEAEKPQENAVAKALAFLLEEKLTDLKVEAVRMFGERGSETVFNAWHEKYDPVIEALRS